ncbi:MAG: hypothetical protein LBT67_00205 [Holosporaceae bacterium]|nr:hypothetical protein [Holosporaceae bacterium]
MKKVLCTAVAVIGVCGVSEGMEGNLEANREIKMRFDLRTRALDVGTSNGAGQAQVHMAKVADEQFVASMPVKTLFSIFTHDPLTEARVLSLLASLNTARFGINPTIDFVLRDDSIDCFNELFAELADSVYEILPFCSVTHVASMIKHLKICSGTCAQTAYTAISTFSESKGDEISKVESYFSNVSEKLDILISMISRKK